MDSILKKLNYSDQKVALVLNAPEIFSDQIEIIKERSQFLGQFDASAVSFAMVFVTRRSELEGIIPRLMPMLEADAVFWICYPKGSSKRYLCDFNRDNGFDSLAQFEMEPVRQVSIDEDWSALRFRCVSFIKTMKRNPARVLSQEGRKRMSN